MAEAYGNVVQHWQAYISAYIVSQDNTRALVRCDCYHHSIKWGYDVGGYGEAIVAGNGSGQKRVTFTSGSGQTRNQHIISKDVWINKGHGGQNVYCKGVVQTTGGYHNGTSTAGVNVWVGAKPSYTVSYNAKGGSGAPGNQTKWYGENLTLSSSKPTRAGHDFLYWTTDFGSGSVTFNPGASYTHNGSATLYANWKAHTYTVSYDANGGTGAPADQTKTYGQTLKLSSTIPTRKNYNFLGWGTSAGSTTVAYAAGANYTNDAPVTLYAIWKLAWLAPRITNLQATRCNSAGTFKEDGQYAKVTFGWATDRTISSINIVCNDVTTNASGSGTSGSVSVVIGANALSAEKSYPVRVTVTDAVGWATVNTVVAAMDYIMDVAPNGSVAFGEPANPDSRQFIVKGKAHFRDVVNASGLYLGRIGQTAGMTDSLIHTTDNFNWSAGNNNKIMSYDGDCRPKFHQHIGLDNGCWLQGQVTPGGTGYTNLLRINENQQVELNWTSGGLKGRVMKEIWSGTWSSGSITVPELPYYNVFMVVSNAYTTPLIGLRNLTNETRALRFTGAYFNWEIPYNYYASMNVTNAAGTTMELLSGGIVERRIDNSTTGKKPVNHIYGIL